MLSTTRFVIVEALFDQLVYQELFDAATKLDSWKGKSPLVFIRASDERNEKGGGCSQVMNWAPKLCAKIPLFSGVIDKDVDNQQAEESVFVLGRYSVENYLLDPIIIFACLVDLGIHDSVFSHESLSDCNPRAINDLKTVELQAIADAIVDQIEKACPSVVTHEISKSEGTGRGERFTVKYTNGNAILVPEWLKTYRGHDLQMVVCGVFTNGEKRIFTRDLDQARLAICRKIPGFIPLDLIRLFSQLSNQ